LSGEVYFFVILAISPLKNCGDKLWPESPLGEQWIPANAWYYLAKENGFYRKIARNIATLSDQKNSLPIQVAKLILIYR
jgi:hypothetical protein